MEAVLEDNKTKVKFEHLLESVQVQLFGYILGLIPNRHDAEDVLQQTNVILCQKQKEYDPLRAEFHTWAYSIARYQIMGHKTRHARSKLCFSNELTEVLATEAVDYETPYIKQQALNKCYKKLPEHMRKIAELRFKRDLSMKEISLCLKRPIGSVTATLSRIRSHIMACIKDAYVEAEQEFYNQ
jgi:RNA polymerase sigma-70 factor (ECF subfamily)